ncbi:MarR family transcriptional regulator [Pantoea sp. BAV 3049]|uniref:MarR family transcriptional regulator n=1 Tax=Pantoea sp. BAV 3049 TaxID=2654188 RepID=UPI00131C0CF9|nr:MarR family transcriptional regulator [Pantoea sp. BAV 3049]
MNNKQTSMLTSSGFALAAADQVSTALWRNTINNRFTQPQFLALNGLLYKPGIGHYELADRVGVDRATIGPILKRLMEQALVERRKDPADSRRSMLSLSSEAHDLLAEMASLVETVDRQLMEPLSAAEQAALVQSWAMLSEENSLQERIGFDDQAADPVIPPLAHYPWFFLRQACRNYRRLWRERVDENISTSLFTLMEVVAMKPEIDIRTAAQLASIEESNAVRMVMRMVRTRMMRDPRDPHDARRSLLSLTANGLATFQALQARFPLVQRGLTQKLPPLAVEEFHRLTRLVARL